MHGDDITSDSSGEDCYRYVKAADRFLVVKRTPGISTTDLVGRMLLCTKNHFIKSLTRMMSGDEGSGNPEERKMVGEEMRQRIKDYATDDTGLQHGPSVFSWAGTEHDGFNQNIVEGRAPQPRQRIVYVDGGFDLFSSGHIEFLRQVVQAEEAIVRKSCQDEDNEKVFHPAYVVVGVHDDEVINHWKGINYPIMNIFERGLCVLQCRYVNSVVFGAPFTPSKFYLTNLPYGKPNVVYHGPTSFIPLTYDPYTAARNLGIYQELGGHDFQNVNAGEIVQRILKSREMYEARQRAKGEKATTEEAVREREVMEREAADREKERAGSY